MRGACTFAPAAARLSGALLVVALAAGAGGCREEATHGPESPTRVRVDPEAEGGTRLPPGPRSGPIPTWTLPHGLEAATMPVGAIPTLGAALPGPPDGGSRAEGIPVPTPQPTLDLAGSAPALTDPDVLKLMAQIDERRLADDVRRLTDFGTRHALSATDDKSQGVGAAREWLFGRFDRLDARQDRQVLTEFEDFTARIGGERSTQRNVIATLPGIGLDKRIVYVTAHYDSRGQDQFDGESDAPGADDNASGTAALLELARVMSGRSWDSTIRFAGFAASETGLAGSQHHAPRARDMKLPVVAVINNDTIGGSLDLQEGAESRRLRVYSADGDSGGSRQLARYAQVVGERYLDMHVEIMPGDDRAGDSSDQGPFSEAGFAAARITGPGDDDAHLDGPGDTVEGVDSSLLADVTRLNLAIAANLALAPPEPGAAPRLAASPDHSDSLQVSWDPLPHPRAVGYWVLVRSGESERYERAEWAGTGPTYTLTGLAFDGAVAVAVAASDDRGHLSLFSPEATR